MYYSIIYGHSNRAQGLILFIMLVMAANIILQCGYITKYSLYFWHGVCNCFVLLVRDVFVCLSFFSLLSFPWFPFLIHDEMFYTG